jgi:hypothetical protein
VRGEGGGGRGRDARSCAMHGRGPSPLLPGSCLVAMCMVCGARRPHPGSRVFERHLRAPPQPPPPSWLCRRGGAARRPTLLGGYCGASPPPTMASMLQRKSISTMPMPPLLKPRQNCGAAARGRVHKGHEVRARAAGGRPPGARHAGARPGDAAIAAPAACEAISGRPAAALLHARSAGAQSYGRSPQTQTARLHWPVSPRRPRPLYDVRTPRPATPRPARTVSLQGSLL